MSNDWTLSSEGLSPGLALLAFIVLAGLVVVAYRRFAPDVPAWKRAVLTALRAGLLAVFLVLLVKPVLNLTVHENVRQILPVLLDVSQSMTLKDHRVRPDDLKRAAIATGALDPSKGLKQELPADAAGTLGKVSRWDLLRGLAANRKLDLWRRLQAGADLAFYAFGRDTAAVPSPAPAGTPAMDAAAATKLFQTLQPDKPATAIGDALRQVIQETQDRPVAGIVLVTDGQNNAGTPPVEAAQIARDHNIPLFIYGVGVTAAPDLILESLNVQKLAFVQERIEVRAKVRLQGLRNKTISATLKANGVEEDQQTLVAGEEGEYEIALHLVPQEVGDMNLGVALAPLPEETIRENNSASAQLRVTDTKFHVLLIEQEPRWDFRYLLAYLQRDRRLEVQCVMINGEPDLDKLPDSPFLPALPNDREDFFRSQVLILGDVNPEDLGDERMQIIREWVDAGGGLIFLAGSKFNPTAYVGTPLEALLPIVPDAATLEGGQSSPDLFKLQLTSLGETSTYLQMSPDPEENNRIWDEFPGVRWTAPALRAKPGAEVLLVDPRPERSGRYGAPPVFATQPYGSGTCVYIGTDETYRWRSKTGEQYYSVFWGQIMQSLALQLLSGASPHTQLRADRQQYSVGDTVTISGKAFLENFAPLLAPQLDGVLTFASTDANGKTSTQKQALNLAATPDARGFLGGFTAKAAGEYEYSTTRDPEAVLRFAVTEPRLEKIQTALNERLLKSMADISGGHFFREEDLDHMPQFVSRKTTTVESYRRLEIYHSCWWLVALIVLASAEWLLRRLNQLK